MPRSKLEKMSRYSANRPPEWWTETTGKPANQYRADCEELWDKVKPLPLPPIPQTYLTEDDVKALYSKSLIGPTQVDYLRPALEYIFGDDDAMENPPF